MNNKGLSGVIMTVIMIALVLIAVGIIWAVYGNIIKSGAGGAEIQAKCLDVSLEVTAVTCPAPVAPATLYICSATVKRNAGGETISGLKYVFKTATASGTTPDQAAINILETKTYAGLATALTVVPTKVEIYPYFLDDTGKQVICTQPVEHTVP